MGTKEFCWGDKKNQKRIKNFFYIRFCYVFMSRTNIPGGGGFKTPNPFPLDMALTIEALILS